MEGRVPASTAFRRISSLGVTELRPPDALITGASGCGLARVAIQAFPSFIRHSDFVILVICVVREPSRRDRQDTRQSREGTRRASREVSEFQIRGGSDFTELRFANSVERKVKPLFARPSALVRQDGIDRDFKVVT
jgi:hypothetical protein